MRKIFLIISLFVLVIILIVSFANIWVRTPVSVFFSTPTLSLTLGFLMMSFLGIMAGFFFAMFLTADNSSEEKETSESEEY